jgi:hypothetical protein
MQEALRNDQSLTSSSKRVVVKPSAMGLARNNYASAYFQLISLPPPLRHYILALSGIKPAGNADAKTTDDVYSAPPLKSFTAPAWPWGFVPLNTLLHPLQGGASQYRDPELEELLGILPPPDIFDVTDGSAAARAKHRRNTFRSEDVEVFGNLKYVSSMCVNLRSKSFILILSWR